MLEYCGNCAAANKRLGLVVASCGLNLTIANKFYFYLIRCKNILSLPSKSPVSATIVVYCLIASRADIN